jgi:hypothetical protein
VNYAPDQWHDFAVTVGGLAGALTGLLFVALSIKGEALAASVSLRSRAAQTLVLFLTSAITAIVLVAPQPQTGVAVELLVLAAISGAALFVLDRRAGHDVQNSVARYVGGVINAWLFLLKVPGTAEAPRPQDARG